MASNDIAIQKFLSVLHDDLDPTEYIELRGFRDSRKNIRLFTQSVAEAVAWVKEHRTDYNMYVGVNPRISNTRGKNEDVKFCRWVWIDIDSKKLNDIPADQILAKVMRRIVLPPHIVVFTGGGVHLYYRIVKTEDLTEVQRVCNLLAAEIGGDPLGDPARVFRIPSTFNYKYDEPRDVKLAHCNVDFEYNLSDIIAAVGASEKTARRVDTGDSRGFLSRSERDWNVVRALLKLGMDEETVEYVFTSRSIGDKASESDPNYFERTIRQAKESVGIGDSDEEEDVSPTPVHKGKDPESKKPSKGSKTQRALHERWRVVRADDCMFAVDTASDDGDMRQISTFSMVPKVLLQGNLDDKTEDTMICDIKAAGYTWENIAFTRGAFNRVDTMTKQLPAMAWQWLGTDKDVRRLLAVLMDELRLLGLPKRKGTPVIGLHGEEFVGPTQTMTAKGILDPNDAKVVWLPTQKSHPEISFTWSGDDEVSSVLQEFVELYKQINEPAVIYPVLGWYAAALLKTRLFEESRIRFPILNIFGTRGSGKTSLITGVMQPLVCYHEPVAMDFNSTKFVMLSILGSTNAIPVSFAEYRRSSTTNDTLERYVRLSYDRGEDSRGRPDQSMQNYPLIAPFTIDGEDSIADPACLERMIQITMHPESIEEGSQAYDAFQTLRDLPLDIIGTRLIAWILDYEIRFEDAMDLVKAAFPVSMPDRVRKNFAVVTVGLQAFEGFCELLEVDFPLITPKFLAEVLTPALNNIVNQDTGRTYLPVDELVTDLINAVAQSVDQRPPNFIFKYEKRDNIFYFQLTTALSWWYKHRAAQRLEVRDSAAMKAQLRERMPKKGGRTSPGLYVMEPMTKTIDRRPTHVYAVDIEMAVQTGLDIGSKLNSVLELYSND